LHEILTNYTHGNLLESEADSMQA